jgi:hypothetical protein
MPPMSTQNDVIRLRGPVMNPLSSRPSDARTGMAGARRVSSAIVNSGARSVAFVPAEPGEWARLVAGQVADLMMGRGIRVKLIPLEGASPPDAERMLKEILSDAAAGTTVLTSVDSVGHSDLALGIAASVQAVVLAVPLGKATLESVRDAADAVGRERMLGVVTVRRR